MGFFPSINPSMPLDLQIEQERIASTGGEVLLAERQITPAHGYLAFFRDTEGNRLPLPADA